MLIEYTLTDTTNGQTMRVNADVLASHGCALEEFIAIQAEDWCVTPDQITIAEEDITHLLYAPKITDEWKRAAAFQESLFDENEQRSVMWAVQKMSALGIYLSDDAAAFRSMVDAYDAALIGLTEDGCLWDQYAANRARILADLDPLPYTRPEGLPTIYEAMAEARRVIREHLART